MLMSFFCSCVIIALCLSSFRLGEHFSWISQWGRITTRQLTIIQWFISLRNVEVDDHNNLKDVKTAPPKKNGAIGYFHSNSICWVKKRKLRFAWCAGLSFFGSNTGFTIFLTVRTKSLFDNENSVDKCYTVVLRIQKCHLWLCDFAQVSWLLWASVSLPVSEVRIPIIGD